MSNEKIQVVEVLVGFEARKNQAVDFAWGKFSVIATLLALIAISAIIGFRSEAIVDAITYYPV